mmetsp:Transcript_11014/g.25171  ORF Transcript_11014/g.25171 Transcript_11014/m.25171 type:complete len:597 (+) Transcript_11014:146-1936(+)
MGSSPSCGSSCGACDKAHRGCTSSSGVSIERVEVAAAGKADFFPTFCMPMPAFAKLRLMAAHEAVLDDLVQPPDDAIVHFVSHEWLGFSHPDPDGTQLRLMQAVFRKFADGEARSLFHGTQFDDFTGGVSSGTAPTVQQIEREIAGRLPYKEEELPIHVTKGSVWLDYSSIPQDQTRPDFLAAVNSIPRYVERCNYFWVCAPSAVHRDLRETRDYYTWRGRGWCRLEEAANFLCKTLKMPLLVTTESTVLTYGWLDRMNWNVGRPERSVANGQFTCCRFDHRVPAADGSTKFIPCDKDALGPVLLGMFESRYSHVLAQGGETSLDKLGMLRTVASTTLAGYEDQLGYEVGQWVASEAETLADFLPKNGFTCWDDFKERCRSGGEDQSSIRWSLIFWALMYANMSTIKDLLSMQPELLYMRSRSNVAMIPYAMHRPPSEFKDLLSWNPRSRSPEELSHASIHGYTAVDRAAKLGFHENLRYILELGAFVDPVRETSGATPLISSADEGYPLCTEVLLEFKANIHATDKAGCTALHRAAYPLAILGNMEVDGKLKVLKVLIKGRANLDRQNSAGKTALQIAVAASFFDAVDLLLQHVA